MESVLQVLTSSFRKWWTTMRRIPHFVPLRAGFFSVPGRWGDLESLQSKTYDVGLLVEWKKQEIPHLNFPCESIPNMGHLPRRMEKKALASCSTFKWEKWTWKVLISKSTRIFFAVDPTFENVGPCAPSEGCILKPVFTHLEKRTSSGLEWQNGEIIMPEISSHGILHPSWFRVSAHACVCVCV